MKAKEIENLELSNSETRDIITPYAFKIDQSLLGLPLATPTKRAMAMIIDVALIFLAAKISAAIIAVVASVAFYRSTAQKHLPNMSKAARRTLKVIATSLFFVCTIYLFSVAIDYLEGNDSSEVEDKISLTSAELAQVKVYLEATSSEQECDDTCQNELLTTLINDIQSLQKLGEIEQSNITRLLLWSLVESEKGKELEHAKEAVIDVDEPSNRIVAPSTSPQNSLLDWLKGIIEDLGLGFGWAAIYFTLFSLLWKGQTPGKKICNIRVVALNGEYLSLWDSFGRYGGYGAGFATGLLGFLQIYWDPNRQAIQDKISSTVVIKGSVKQTVNAATIADNVADHKAVEHD